MRKHSNRLSNFVTALDSYRPTVAAVMAAATWVVAT